MTITTRFGKKLKVPLTFQIKHQLLLFWLKNQVAKEAAEDKTDEGVASRDKSNDGGRPHPRDATYAAATRPRRRGDRIEMLFSAAQNDANGTYETSNNVRYPVAMG